MAFLFCLFPAHRRYKNYVLIESDGCCIGFKTCTQSPGEKWIEIKEINLSWLNKPMTNGCRPTPEKTI